MNTGIRTWPWFLGVTLALLAACFYPPFLEWLLRADESMARWCNSFAGRNRSFDLAISVLNTRMADALLIAGYVVVFNVHARRPANGAERLKRSVFWIITVLIFGIVHMLQQTIEGSLSRDSPGRVLSGWYDLRDHSEIAVRVSKSYCFPSGHASAYFFFAFMAIREFRFMGIALFVLAIVLPTTRIITGAHWPTDNLASFLLMGLVAGVICETRLWRVYPLAVRMSGDLVLVFRDRHKRGILERLGSAWKTFVGIEPLKPSEQPPMQPPDPPQSSPDRSLPGRDENN